MKKKKYNSITRREFFYPFLASGLTIATSPLFIKASKIPDAAAVRKFHASLSMRSLLDHPELPSIVRDAGVTNVWSAPIYFGEFRHSPETVRKQADRIEKLGMNFNIITIPLGHPSDPIGFGENPTARTAPSHWKNACNHNSEYYSGTSIHAPAVKENAEAHKILSKDGYDAIFLDDDFRLAPSPGQIGGCFCENCRDEFLSKYGYSSSDWQELIASVSERRLSPVLESWVENSCEKLHNMFLALKNAAPDIDLGIMVMYFGSEKAGIDLEKYRQVPFRVGEMMFNDEDFIPVKGKTNELFSVLFHRRFTSPELAFSETTIFPKGALSAKNLAAKLCITLIADIRNTMFMSGINPIPFHYWDTLSKTMKKSAKLHEDIAGHIPKGPLKHYWGKASRYAGRDNPFSLFLASGIPFEVAEDLTDRGWFFLSDEDAMSFSGQKFQHSGKKLVVRDKPELKNEHFLKIKEDIPAIMEFKKSITPTLKDIPYIDGDNPVVFAWYPSAGKALIWNVNESRQEFRVVLNDRIIQNISVEGLDIEKISV